MSRGKLLSASVAVLLGALQPGVAQEQSFFVQHGPAQPPKDFIYNCSGAVNKVIDVGNETWKTTTTVFGSGAGGGEGGQFDKTPVLTTKVTLADGVCLDAHFSVIAGGPQFYGASSLALYQVTLTPSGGGSPVHMFGHYETPYGIPSPAVALGPEVDVDMLGANFFQHVGTGRHDVPPGSYRVDVWWAGAPPGAAGGAVGAAFVLKLYTRK